VTKADGENSLILHDRKAVSTAAAVAVVVVLLVVAAAAAYYVFYYQTSSSSSSSSSSTTTGPLPGKGMSVGVVFDIGGIGDRGFNELAYDGMLQANSTLGVDYKYEVATQTSLIPNLFATLIGDHLNLIVGIGFDMDSAIAQYSAQYPNQKFAQVDGDIYNITNVVAIKYQEHIGSAIVGALAAAMAGNGQKIGFLGGVTTGIIYKFWNGWKAGAAWADQYLTKVTGSKYNNTLDQVYDSTTFAGFADVPGGFSNGQAMIAKGDKIIFTAAGGTGIGTFNAIGQYDTAQGWNWSNSTAPPVWAIGVDANQDYYGTKQYFTAAEQNTTATSLTAPSFILTSEIKKVDLGVFDVIKWVVEGNFSNVWSNPTKFAPSFYNGQTDLCGSTGDQPCHVQGVFLLGLAQGAVGVTNFQYTSSFLTPIAKQVMQQITQGIVNGSITIPEDYSPSGN